MKSYLRLALALTAMLMVQSVFGQSAERAAGGATAVLEFFDDEKQLKIFNADGFEYSDIFVGLELTPGDRVQTANSSVELRLNPNGSIIKLKPNTNFQITSLKTASGGKNEFNLVAGKIRTVAAKASGANEYQFRTRSAVAGVRGTDFGMEVVEGKSDRLIVREGLVDFTQNGSGKTVSLPAGSGADALARDFSAQKLTTKDLADFFQGMDFQRLNPATVPSVAPASPAASPSPAAETVAEASGAGTPAADTAPAADPAAPADSTPAPSPSAAPAASPAPTLAPGNDFLTDAVLEMIKKYLGLEIGSITIDGVTYGKLLVQPKIDLPDFKMQLYLPVMYQSDLFDPLSWYHPQGNNEWSFGTDQGDAVDAIILDVVSDLILKIRYVELFDQGDPFFLKVGSIPSMTLGHGILIGGYANDADFPAIRRLGFNLGVDLGNVAIELLTNDLARPELIGTRIKWQPVAPTYKIGAAFSAAVDLNPTANLDPNSTDPATVATLAAKPVFINLALDLEVPIFDSEVFDLMVFGDFGGMLPYFTNGFTANGYTVAAGAQWNQFVGLATAPAVGIEFQNYGIEAGVLGKVLFLDYRLEYQYFTGSFQPAFYDASYDRTKGQKAIELYNLFSSAPVESPVRMGIFGKVGFDIADLLYFSVGYKWPWTVGTSDLVPDGNPDWLGARLYFAKDALPFGLGFSIGFEREYFVPVFSRPTSYTFLDGYAVFNGQIDVPIGNFFKIRLTVGTAAKRDAAGAVVLSEGKIQMAPTFSLESVF